MIKKIGAELATNPGCPIVYGILTDCGHLRMDSNAIFMRIEAIFDTDNVHCKAFATWVELDKFVRELHKEYGEPVRIFLDQTFINDRYICHSANTLSKADWTVLVAETIRKIFTRLFSGASDMLKVRNTLPESL